MLLAREGIQHVDSRMNQPQTFGKCERLCKTVAVESWDRVGPEELDVARRRMALWGAHYNHFRPHQGIDGLVPAARFFGAESALSETLEQQLLGNGLRLSLGGAPRRPVYLVGQIGDERIALHGERGRLLIDTPDGGHRELALDELGIEGARDDERDDTAGGAEIDEPGQSGNARTRPIINGFDAERETEAQANRPQTHALPATEGDPVAGPRPVGSCALWDDGRAFAAAPDASGARGVPADERRERRRTEEARRDPREGARADGGPGARAADGPMSAGRCGLDGPGGPETWNEAAQEDQQGKEVAASEPAGKGTHSRSGSGSDKRSWRQRRASWRSWLKRSESSRGLPVDGSGWTRR